jgi:hypothetical protein
MSIAHTWFGRMIASDEYLFQGLSLEYLEPKSPWGFQILSELYFDPVLRIYCTPKGCRIWNSLDSRGMSYGHRHQREAARVSDYKQR